MEEFLWLSVLFLHKATLAALFLSVIAGLWRFGKLDLPSRIFLSFNIASCICEWAVFFLGTHGNYISPLYQIYSLLEFTLISLYFNYSIEVFKARNIGYYIAGIGIMVGIANIIWFQPMHSDNTNFINFEGLFIISMCMFSLVRMLVQNEDASIIDSPHFWFTSILAFFWSVTSAAWGARDYFRHTSRETLMGISAFILLVLSLSSLFTALVYLRYPRFKKIKELTGKKLSPLKKIHST